MPKRDLIVIGASAGAFESLRWLSRALPPSFPASLVLVLHLAPTKPSQLAEFLDSKDGLRAVRAIDGQTLRPGVIHVAPPNQHVFVEGDVVRLDSGPHENGFRPAIDRLFRSAALERGPRAIGVILSGMRDDGTEGLALIKRAGGIALVQDPAEALYPSMPSTAIENVAVDAVLGLRDIPRALQQYVNAEAANPAEGTVTKHEHIAENEAFVCPECGGVAREMREGDLVRYRCRVGHVYSAESFVEEHSRGVEDALWAAVNALTERKSLTSRMARRAREQGRANLAERYEELARDADARAEAIRKLLIPPVEQSVEDGEE